MFKSPIQMDSTPPAPSTLAVPAPRQSMFTSPLHSPTKTPKSPRPALRSPTKTPKYLTLPSNYDDSLDE